MKTLAGILHFRAIRLLIFLALVGPILVSQAEVVVAVKNYCERALDRTQAANDNEIPGRHDFRIAQLKKQLAAMPSLTVLNLQHEQEDAKIPYYVEHRETKARRQINLREGLIMEIAFYDPKHVKREWLDDFFQPKTFADLEQLHKLLGALHSPLPLERLTLEELDDELALLARTYDHLLYVEGYWSRLWERADIEENRKRVVAELDEEWTRWHERADKLTAKRQSEQLQWRIGALQVSGQPRNFVARRVFNTHSKNQAYDLADERVFKPLDELEEIRQRAERAIEARKRRGDFNVVE